MLLRCLAAVALSIGPVAQDSGATLTQRFRNLHETFEIDLPVGWQLLPPNQAARLSDDPKAPQLLHLSLPRQCYAVGPTEAWQAGDFSGPWLYVVELDEPWYLDDQFATTITEHWRLESERSGTRHEVTEIREEQIGTQQSECVTSLRLATPPLPQQPLRSLDVNVPTASQQLVLSFLCPPESFDRWQPEFRRWLATMTFARAARQRASLADRLWSPIITGALVGVVLIVLYRYTRGRRQAAR